jgi:hypothetical protein
MDFLDADDTRLFSSKHQNFQERDNVQFVEFNKFKHNPHLLAKETLEELPTQMIEYYKKRDITPSSLSSTFVDMEARDYFSHIGMEHIDKVGRMNYSHEDIAKVVNQGIPFLEN